MKYINKKTNIIIDVKSKISGGDWIPFEEPKRQSKKK
jgi:hypothetical protein